MVQTPVEVLRSRIAEVIPDGGLESDTMFTNAQLTQVLFDNGADVDRATYAAWLLKAANYADLVDVSEGNATRAMSDLHDHALKMAKTYATAGSSLVAGRTRVGRIRRSY